MPCTTVSVADPTPDRSSLEVVQLTPENAPPGEYRVEVSYRNVIESGEGEEIPRDIRVTLDGEEVTREPVGAPPGETRGLIVEGEAEPGDHQFCAEVV